MSRPSPLGRYDDQTAEDALHEVRLLGVPVRLYATARERHDELLREFALLALSGAAERTDVPARLLALIESLGVRYGAAAARPDDVLDAALERGDDTIELSYTVPAHVVEGADALERLMAEADEFCRGEQLLTLARDDVQRRFASWYLEEFRRQVSGAPPLPWDGPLD